MNYCFGSIEVARMLAEMHSCSKRCRSIYPLEQVFIRARTHLCMRQNISSRRIWFLTRIDNPLIYTIYSIDIHGYIAGKIITGIYIMVLWKTFLLVEMKYGVWIVLIKSGKRPWPETGLESQVHLCRLLYVHYYITLQAFNEFSKSDWHFLARFDT